MPFRIALSGLNAASADLKTTGNNIANAGTTGFKQSRTEFVDVFAVSFGGISSTATGGGVRLASVAQQFSQGNVEYTNNSLDLAINGQGFYVLDDNGSRLLTRAGAFRADRDGFVANSAQQRLQVFPATTTAAGTTSFDTGRLADLQLSTSEGPPSATTVITSVLNLDASEPTLTPTTFNPSDPSTYNSSTSITVYDSLGTQHTATQYFVKEAANNWVSFMYLGDGPTDPNFQPVQAVGPNAAEVVTSAVPAPNADGYRLVFDSATGQLVTPATPITYNPAPVATISGADPIPLSLNYRDVTQYGSPFAVSALSQDGFASGRLSGIDIDQEGVVSARFTNGQSQILGKIAMANVANPQSLSPQGDTVWGETYAAGDVLLGEAGTASFGLIQSGALEASNVDVAQQLVNLITAQRNFQANAQVISTADTVTQTIINIR